jgi:cytochrome c5
MQTTARSFFRKPATWLIAGALVTLATFTGCEKKTTEPEEPDYYVCTSASDTLCIPREALADTGMTVYNGYCTGCHNLGGQGSAGSTPPHANADWFMNNKHKTIITMLAGLTDSIFVNGMWYHGEMPSFKDNLSNREIAGILTYLRTVLNDSTVVSCVTYNAADTSTYDVNGFPRCTKVPRTLAARNADTVAVWEVKAVRDSIDEAAE